MKASILIVEDEAIVAASLASKLDKLGYGISGSTGHGEDAVRLAQENHPDLVLMDILLAGETDGIEAAQQIRTQCDLPVIYLTAHSDRDTLQRAKITEPFGYILKPFEEIELESHIQMALYKHESERRLRESEERFRVLSEATFEGIAITENGFIIDLNEQLSEMSGFDRLELLGQPVTKFVVPDDQDKAREAYLSGEKRQGIYRGLRKDGTMAIFEASSRPFIWQGKDVRVMAIRDVTALKEAEQALLESSQQIQQQLNEIQTYYDTAPVGLCILDTDLRYVKVNRRMAKLNGASEAEHLGRSIYDLVPGIAQPQEVVFRKVLDHDIPARDIEFSGETPAHPGITRYWTLSAYPLKNSSGRPVGINIIVKDMTDLKMAEQALRQSEERLKLAITAAQEAIYDLNLEDASFSCNEVYRNFIGAPPENSTPVHWWISKIHDDDQVRVTMNFQHALEGNADTCIEEYRLQRPDETWAHVYDRAVIARNEAGEAYRLVGAIMDITARKKAEDELYYSRERLKTAQQAGSIGTFDWNIRTGETTWTAELEHIYGLDSGGFAGDYDTWVEFIHPDDRKKTLEILRRALVECTGFRTEFRIIRHDGAVRWVGAWGKVVFDERKEQLRMVGANVDITERKQIESFTDQYLTRLNTLINFSFDIIAQTNRQDLMQCIVDAARDLTGARIAITGHGFDENSFEISAVSSSSNMPPCPTGRTFAVEKGGVYLDLLKNAEPVCFTDQEMRNHRDWWGLPEDHAPLHGLCGAPLTAADGKAQGLLMVSNKEGHDEFSEIDYAIVTQLAALSSLALQHMTVTQELEKRAQDLSISNKKLEEEIRRRTLAEQILMQYTDDLSRSNEELDSFASAVSHDLQEPLRSVASLIKLLERKSSDKLDSQGKEYIFRALESTKRLEVMIQNLLAYSRITTRGKEFEYIELEQVLASAVENLQASISGTKAVISHSPLPQVHGDADQLVRVFQNLIGNSMKYCAEKQPEIHIESAREDDEFIISFKDNGEGIEPDYLDHIFEVFSRSPSKLHVSGSGMGLAVCKKIILRHKGRIWVQSDPAKGSTFYISLPIPESEANV